MPNNNIQREAKNKKSNKRNELGIVRENTRQTQEQEDDWPNNSNNK